MQLKMPIDRNSQFTKLDEYAAKFGGNFVIGYSGGGDSMALLAICKEWQEARSHSGINVNIHPCIIDHGIAANSFEVAETAKLRAKKMGINAEIIRLDEKIDNKIQENARRLRHTALGEFANSKSASIILLAHNKDDQIETILFRMLRSTGLDGLAGIQELNPSPFAKNIVLARPLMDISRVQLRKYLELKGLDYFDDPANTNVKFSRVKIRQRLANLKDKGIDFEKLLLIGHKSQLLRNNLNGICAEYLKSNLQFFDQGIILKNHKDLSSVGSIFCRTIDIILAAHSARDYRIEPKKVENLCQKIHDDNFKAATLAGVKVEKLKSNLIFKFAKPRKGESAITTSVKEVRDRINLLLWHNGADI